MIVTPFSVTALQERRLLLDEKPVQEQTVIDAATVGLKTPVGTLPSGSSL